MMQLLPVVLIVNTLISAGYQFIQNDLMNDATPAWSVDSKHTDISRISVYTE